MTPLGTWSITRLTVAFVGLMLAVVAGGLTEPYVFSTLVDSVPRLWESLFLLAALVTVAFAATRRRLLANLSIAIIGLVLTSRLAALAFLLPSPAWPGVAGWAIVIALITWGWPIAADQLEAERMLDRRQG